MLVSDVLGWHYFISWDNPVPPDSSKIIEALEKLGRVTRLTTKTTVALSPGASSTEHDVQNAIKGNISKEDGNAVYVNVHTGKGFQIGKETEYLWKIAP